MIRGTAATWLPVSDIGVHRILAVAHPVVVLTVS